MMNPFFVVLSHAPAGRSVKIVVLKNRRMQRNAPQLIFGTQKTAVAARRLEKWRISCLCGLAWQSYQSERRLEAIRIS